MSINLRFLRAEDYTTQFKLYQLNLSGGEMIIRTWTTVRKRFGKWRKLATKEKSKQVCHMDCGGQAAQSWKIYGRCLTTWTIVLRSSKYSGGSSPKSYEIGEMFARCQISRYQFTLAQYLLSSSIVIFSHSVFWQAGKACNSHGIHVWALWSCRTPVLLGSISILLQGRYSSLKVICTIANTLLSS